jgi:translation initiation factor 1
MNKRKEQINPLVYSTEGGRVIPEKNPTPSKTTSRGSITIQRERKGHQGKTVTLIAGLPLQSSELHALAAELKKVCGCGGSVKDGVILIQGDKRDHLFLLLTARGYNPKIVGG